MWENGPVKTIMLQLPEPHSEVSVSVHIVEGTDKVVLIDSGLVQGYEQIDEGLQEAGVKERVALLLNTHEHMDHIGNNSRIARETGCLVGAHYRRAPWIEDHDLGAEQMVRRFPDVEPEFDPKHEYKDWMEDGGTSVNLHLSEGDLVNLGGGVELEVLELHGHSLGEIGFYEPGSRTLIFGDALMPSHTPNLFLYEDPNEMKATCRRVMQLAREREIETALSGHTEPQTREGVIEWGSECLDLTNKIERKVVETVADSPGISLGNIRDEVTDHFEKLAEWRALITVAGHLRDLENRGAIESQDEGWAKR